MWRPEDWQNPYSLQKVTVQGEELFKISNSHFVSADTKEANIFEAGADAVLEALLEALARQESIRN